MCLCVCVYVNVSILIVVVVGWLLLLLQERAKMQRNQEYQMLQSKLESSPKSQHIRWWKDHSEQDVKPYSVSWPLLSVNES